MYKSFIYSNLFVISFGNVGVMLSCQLSIELTITAFSTRHTTA